MRQTREILRLHFESNLSPRQIAAICKVGKGTVQRYLRRLEAAGVSWPLPADLDDVALERCLFPPPPVVASQERPLPDWAAVHRELKSRKNVTLQLLWEEYREVYPAGYHYSWYCERYRQWQQKLDVVMRQEHRAGEKTFVDHAGQTVPVTDPQTGVVREAYVFVAVLGASSYTYAEATWTRNLWDWIQSHCRRLAYAINSLPSPTDKSTVLISSHGANEVTAIMFGKNGNEGVAHREAESDDSEVLPSVVMGSHCRCEQQAGRGRESNGSGDGERPVAPLLK
jgi:Bacterial regulatory protein, arsR family